MPAPATDYDDLLQKFQPIGAGLAYPGINPTRDPRLDALLNGGSSQQQADQGSKRWDDSGVAGKVYNNLNALVGGLQNPGGMIRQAGSDTSALLRMITGR